MNYFFLHFHNCKDEVKRKSKEQAKIEPEKCWRTHKQNFGAKVSKASEVKCRKVAEKITTITIATTT